jgi:hypothetical protein
MTRFVHFSDHITFDTCLKSSFAEGSTHGGGIAHHSVEMQTPAPFDTEDLITKRVVRSAPPIFLVCDL